LGIKAVPPLNVVHALLYRNNTVRRGNSVAKLYQPIVIVAFRCRQQRGKFLLFLGGNIIIAYVIIKAAVVEGMRQRNARRIGIAKLNKIMIPVINVRNMPRAEAPPYIVQQAERICLFSIKPAPRRYAPRRRGNLFAVPHPRAGIEPRRFGQHLFGFRNA